MDSAKIKSRRDLRVASAWVFGYFLMALSIGYRSLSWITRPGDGWWSLAFAAIVVAAFHLARGDRYRRARHVKGAQSAASGYIAALLLGPITFFVIVRLDKDHSGTFVNVWMATIFLVALTAEGPGELPWWRVALVQGCSVSLAMSAALAVVGGINDPELPTNTRVGVVIVGVLLVVIAYGLWPRSGPPLRGFVHLGVATIIGCLASFGVLVAAVVSWEIVNSLLGPQMTQGERSQTIVAVAGAFAGVGVFVARWLKKLRGFGADLVTSSQVSSGSDALTAALGLQTELLLELVEMMRRQDERSSKLPHPDPAQLRAWPASSVPALGRGVANLPADAACPSPTQGSSAHGPS